MLVVRKTEEQVNTISIGALDPGAVCERNGEIVMKVCSCNYTTTEKLGRMPCRIVNLRTGKTWLVHGDQMVKPIKARCIIED